MIGKLFSLRECAEWAEVSRETVKSWVHRDECLYQQFGNQYYLNPEELSMLLWNRAPHKANEFDKMHRIIYENENDGVM
jgi:hypothetical protein